jgi:hypothetical protein
MFNSMLQDLAQTLSHAQQLGLIIAFGVLVFAAVAVALGTFRR